MTFFPGWWRCSCYIYWKGGYIIICWLCLCLHLTSDFWLYGLLFISGLFPELRFPIGLSFSSAIMLRQTMHLQEDLIDLSSDTCSILIGSPVPTLARSSCLMLLYYANMPTQLHHPSKGLVGVVWKIFGKRIRCKFMATFTVAIVSQRPMVLIIDRVL